jgi:hypothetical protein
VADTGTSKVQWLSTAAPRSFMPVIAFAAGTSASTRIPATQTVKYATDTTAVSTLTTRSERYGCIAFSSRSCLSLVDNIDNR